MACRFLRIVRDQGFQNVIGLFGAAIALVALGAILQDHKQSGWAFVCYALAAVIGVAWVLATVLLVRDHIIGTGGAEQKRDWLPVRTQLASFSRW